MSKPSDERVLEYLKGLAKRADLPDIYQSLHTLRDDSDKMSIMEDINSFLPVEAAKLVRAIFAVNSNDKLYAEFYDELYGGD